MRRLWTSSSCCLHVLTITAGTSLLQRCPTARRSASIVGSFGCRKVEDFEGPPPDPCINRQFNNLDSQGLQRTYSGFRSRANLSWKASGDALLYYTLVSRASVPGLQPRLHSSNSDFSAVRRHGARGAEAAPVLHQGFEAPIAFAPDTVNNNELGWKTSWIGQGDYSGTGRCCTREETGITSQIFVNAFDDATLNGGDYRVRGVETSGSARLFQRASRLNLGAAWNHSALVRLGTFYWVDGTPINFFALRYEKRRPDFQTPPARTGQFPFRAPAIPGQRSACATSERLTNTAPSRSSPPVHQSLLAPRPLDDITLQTARATASRPTSCRPFSSYDGSALGSRKGNLDGAGLRTEPHRYPRPQLYANNSQGYKAVTVSRPRTIGMQFSYKFHGT